MKVVEFNQDLKHSLSEGEKLLFFFAKWSVPAVYTLRTLQNIGGGSLDNLEAILIDVDKNLDLVREYKVVVLPTLILVRNGEQKAIIEGYKGTETLKGILLKVLEN